VARWRSLRAREYDGHSRLGARDTSGPLEVKTGEKGGNAETAAGPWGSDGRTRTDGFVGSTGKDADVDELYRPLEFFEPTGSTAPIKTRIRRTGSAIRRNTLRGRRRNRIRRHATSSIRVPTRDPS
jgi:hypothetical protein